MNETSTGAVGSSRRQGVLVGSQRGSWRVWGVLGSLFLALSLAILVVFHWAPVDVNSGLVQKIFYIHMPSALFGYVGFTVCFLASVFYLRRPDARVDAVARAGAESGVFFFAIVLISGPFWALKSWDELWTGEPRLILSLVLFMIFLSYVLVRAHGGQGELTRRVGAVLAIIGFADIPLVHLAVARWGGNHPRVMAEGGMSSQMWTALVLSTLSLGLLFVVLFKIRLEVNLLVEESEALWEDLEDLELVLEER